MARICQVRIDTSYLIWCKGPFFYKHGLTFIPEWISKNIHYKVRDEITYPFQNFNGATIKVWQCNSPHISWECDYLSMLGLKSNHVSKRVKGAQYVRHEYIFTIEQTLFNHSIRTYVTIHSVRGVNVFVSKATTVHLVLSTSIFIVQPNNTTLKATYLDENDSETSLFHCITYHIDVWHHSDVFAIQSKRVINYECTFDSMNTTDINQNQG